MTGNGEPGFGFESLGAAWKALLLGVVVAALALSEGARAQNAAPGAAAAPVVAGAKGAAEKPAEPGPEYLVAPDEPAVRKEFSAGEVRRICEKYQGQLVAYYGEVYKIEKCARRPLLSSKTIYTMMRQGSRVVDIDGDTMAALPEGEPLDLATSESSARSCKELSGKYVSYSAVDVYFVENCKKRIFPDWTTYLKHRAERGDARGEILALSWVEYAQLEDGAPIRSIVDDMFAKLLSGEAGVDVIPVDEACEGVEGKLVSYYARLYKIERCRKREITSPELFLRRTAGAGGIGSLTQKFKVIELRSEQWLSLPDGEPISEPARPKGKATAEN
jgi:hypothetical protein